MRFIDLTGHKFNSLTVIKRIENNKNGRIQWLCKCECGNYYIATSDSLKYGNLKSCDCKPRRLEIDLTGQKFNKLTIIKQNGRNKRGEVLWLCQCECGNTKIAITSELKSGHVKSCGCINKERFTKHNKTHTRLYKIWDGMKARCYNKNKREYKWYGEKGIIICNEWLSDFENFYNWAINNGYKDNLTIDRIDFNGNYEPSNCRWVTYKEQANNKSDNHLIEYNGEIHNITEWAYIKNISRNTLTTRLERGWTIERALTTPAGKYVKKLKMQKMNN